MNGVTEGRNVATSETPEFETRDFKKDFSALLNLQIITEKLLCQLEIPSEIYEKFLMLKAGTYQSIGIDFDDPFVSIDSIFEQQNLSLSTNKVNYQGGYDEQKQHTQSETIKSFVDYLDELRESLVAQNNVDLDNQ